jgi:hypothetical protein
MRTWVFVCTVKCRQKPRRCMRVWIQGLLQRNSSIVLLLVHTCKCPFLFVHTHTHSLTPRHGHTCTCDLVTCAHAI